MFREMRRNRQQLPQEECLQILEKAPRGVLSVMGEDGYPYGVPMDFVLVDGKVYFHSALEGHKLDAIAACDRACLTVLDEGYQNEGEWWWHFRSVVAFGRVRVVPTDDEAWMLGLRALGLKYFPTVQQVDDDIARSGARVRVLELTIDHMTGKAVTEK